MQSSIRLNCRLRVSGVNTPDLQDGELCLLGSWECKEISLSSGKFRLVKYCSYEIRFVMTSFRWYVARFWRFDYGKNISGNNSFFVPLIWNPKAKPSCLQGSPNCWSFGFRAFLCLHTISFPTSIRHDSPDVQWNRINVWYIYLYALLFWTRWALVL